jgi:hypothetical protein
VGYSYPAAAQQTWPGMTRYRVLITDELLAQARENQLHWPAGFRIIDTGHVAKLEWNQPDSWAPVREVTVEDDDAPEELAGRLVEVTLQRDFITYKVTVASRTAVAE